MCGTNLTVVVKKLKISLPAVNERCHPSYLFKFLTFLLDELSKLWSKAT